MNSALEQFLESHEDEIIAKALENAHKQIVLAACTAITAYATKVREIIEFREEELEIDVPPHPWEEDDFVNATLEVCNGINGKHWNLLNDGLREKATSWGNKQIKKQGLIFLGIDPNSVPMASST